MYEKWYTNVFGVISLRGPPRGPTFFLAPPEKMLKSTVFELEQWFLHQNGPFFHQEFNGKGLWVLGSQFCTKKMKNISEFQNSWNFWIFGSWTQPGAWHMIVPFWSWNLSDTTHVRSHTKFQLVWAINTAFTRGGLNQPPPSLKCGAGTPSLLGLRHSICNLHLYYTFELVLVFIVIIYSRNVCPCFLQAASDCSKFVVMSLCMSSCTISRWDDEEI